jgi:hypothetical protein
VRVRANLLLLPALLPLPSLALLHLAERLLVRVRVRVRVSVRVRARVRARVRIGVRVRVGLKVTQLTLALTCTAARPPCRRNRLAVTRGSEPSVIWSPASSLPHTCRNEGGSGHGK